jgi:hypothetical protein
MKNLAVRTLTSLLFGVLVFGVLALGQTAQAQRIQQAVKVSIPFEFTVGDQTFPAGHYTVVRIPPTILELRDAGNRLLFTALTNSVQSLTKPAAAKLQFYSEDGRHALAQVWQAGDSIGQELQPPKAWTSAAKRRSGRVQTAAASKPAVSD